MIMETIAYDCVGFNPKMSNEMMNDVFSNPEKYLSVAFLALGAHTDLVPTEALEALVSMLQVELRERDIAQEVLDF
jgi:hypothetical protein